MSNNSKALAQDLECSVPVAVVEMISARFDSTHGIIAKASAAKHLSAIVASEVDRVVGYGQGKPASLKGARVFTINDHIVEQLEWLISELFQVTNELSEMIYTTQNDYVPIANAAFDVRQGAGK